MYVGPQIAHTGGLLFRLAVLLWGVGGRWLRVAIFVAAGALFLILAAALAGQPALVALTAFAPLVAILLVPARVNPMWLLAIAVWPDRIFENPEKQRVGTSLGGDELRRGVRWVFAFIAVEVGMAFYYAGVEYLAPSVDRTLVLVTFALFVLLALVAASPPGKIRTNVMGVLTVVFVVLTVIFLFGGKDEFGNKLEAIDIGGGAKAAPLELMPTPAGRTFRIHLLGPERLSAPFDIDRWAPTINDEFRYWGPVGTRAQFEDGTNVSLFERVGAKTGEVRFTGPAGRVVTIKVTHRDDG